MNAGSKWSATLVMAITLVLAACGTDAQPPVAYVSSPESEQQELYDIPTEIDTTTPEAENLEELLEYELDDETYDDVLVGEETEGEEVPPALAPEQTIQQPAAPARSPQAEQPIAESVPQATPRAAAVPQTGTWDFEEDLPIPQPGTLPQVAALPPAAAAEEEEVARQPELPPVDTAAFAAEVIRLVNIERAMSGVGALEINPLLRDAALIRARELPTLFSHNRPGGSEWHTVFGEVGLSISGSGENIASGHATPSAVVVGWINSPGHRDNILARNFTQIGVGVYQDANGMLHWVQLFGARIN
ncbi:MAG: CAP domain-containing protein [Oscillospiraceae bacterium]|nr:CAP domain-containing protein [Oscillospiraceae bacterium]